jgi:hypothetical protein
LISQPPGWGKLFHREGRLDQALDRFHMVLVDEGLKYDKVHIDPDIAASLSRP